MAYVHIEKTGLRTYVTGVSYLPVYVQRTTAGGRTAFRVLPVLPGLEPDTDCPLSDGRRKRAWRPCGRSLRPLLYRPNEDISPLDPATARVS